jgi:3-hydroxybutyrate dehydrogenase
MTGSSQFPPMSRMRTPWRPQSLEAVERNGAPTIVIANAGSAESVPFQRTDAALFRATLDVNLTGVFNTFQASFVKMNRAQPGPHDRHCLHCRLKGYAYVSAYCAAKHGVVGLVRSLAQEFAKTGVTVNAICPGFTETPMLHRSIDNIVEKPDDRARRRKRRCAKSIRRDGSYSRRKSPKRCCGSAVMGLLP